MEVQAYAGMEGKRINSLQSRLKTASTPSDTKLTTSEFSTSLVLRGDPVANSTSRYWGRGYVGVKGQISHIETCAKVLEKMASYGQGFF